MTITFDWFFLHFATYITFRCVSHQLVWVCFKLKVIADNWRGKRKLWIWSQSIVPFLTT